MSKNMRLCNYAVWQLSYMFMREKTEGREIPYQTLMDTDRKT